MTTGKYEMRKVPVKSSPPTNQYPAFYRPDTLPVAQPTVFQHRRKITEIYCVFIVSQSEPVVGTVTENIHTYRVLRSWSRIFFSISASVSVSRNGHHWSASE